MEYTALAGLIVAVLTIGGAFVRIIMWINAASEAAKIAKERADEAEEKASAAEAKATTAKERADTTTIQIAAIGIHIDRLETELTRHQIATAKEYVSKETLEKLENRIVNAIEKLGDRIDQMINRQKEPTCVIS